MTNKDGAMGFKDVYAGHTAYAVKTLELEATFAKLARENQRLEADNARLRALILEGEVDTGGRCQWCMRATLGDEDHAADCGAFSSPGVLR